MSSNKKYLRKNAVAERYGTVTRTVDRYVEQGRLPKPIYHGRFPLWDADELDRVDREATRTRPAPQPVG